MRARSSLSPFEAARAMVSTDSAAKHSRSKPPGISRRFSTFVALIIMIQRESGGIGRRARLRMGF